MKRHRAPNFSTAEIMHLLRLIEQYPILKNKKSDAATIRKKHIAWQQLTAEYNKKKNFSPRTGENLMTCYKNQKIRVKKSKMGVKGTIFRTVIKVEDNGPDWDQAAGTESSSHCQNTDESWTNEVTKEDNTNKRVSNHTGGCPPADPLCHSVPILQNVHSLIGPSSEDFYIIPNGTSDGMKEQQALVDIHEKLGPIDLLVENVTTPHHCIPENSELLSVVSHDSSNQSRASLEIPETTSPQDNNGKRRLDSEAMPRKQRLAAKVTSLAAENIELVKLKKEILEIQLCEAKEKLEHERQLRAMEIDEIRKKNEHSAFIRKLEIENIKNAIK